MRLVIAFMLLFGCVVSTSAKELRVAMPKNYSWCDRHRCKEPLHLLGVASWYGDAWQGRTMANGKRFDMRKLTAASWSLPLNSRALIVNLDNGKSVVVDITDRGPEHRLHRVADLSKAAAEQLGYVHAGLTRVSIIPLSKPEQLTTVESVSYENTERDTLLIPNDTYAQRQSSRETLTGGVQSFSETSGPDIGLPRRRLLFLP